jgi:hypothetical protein
VLKSCDVRRVRWSELVRVILKKMFRESEKNREMRTVRAMLREPLTGVVLVACTAVGLQRNLPTSVLCQKLQKIIQTVPEIHTQPSCYYIDLLQSLVKSMVLILCYPR